MKKFTFVLLFTVVLSLFAENTHDGFYMRFQPGMGLGYANYEDFIELNGAAGIFTMHFGYTVADDLIAFGKFSAASLTDPNVTVTIPGLGTFSGESEDTTYSVTSFGAGLTYYLPYDFFFTGSADIAFAKLEITDIYEGSSDPGFGSEISIGKEWSVSDSWGLGAALYSHFSFMTDKDEDTDEEYSLGNVFFGLMFSATYN